MQQSMPRVANVCFEHYQEQHSLGVQVRNPRLSWTLQSTSQGFRQRHYEIKLSFEDHHGTSYDTAVVKRTSPECSLVPWPVERQLRSREIVCARVRVFDDEGYPTSWSEPVRLETGLLEREDWICQRVAAPWAEDTKGPDAEQLHRKEFTIERPIRSARLYVSAQGIYELAINGTRVHDYFFAPGWTAYETRLQYQTYDVGRFLEAGGNCLGVRVAEGWFTGRIGWEGGHRNIWGPHTALMAQLEMTDDQGTRHVIITDDSWSVSPGPVRLAEIYDGEKYDARSEIPGWSTAGFDTTASKWSPVLPVAPLPTEVELTAGFCEPTRRFESIAPVKVSTSPSGETILDFGQNLVGYVRLSGIVGSRGHKITLTHAEILEHGEVGTRPLRECDAIDEYTLKGSETPEAYEPRFTFHGFRFVQVQGWNGGHDLLAQSAEAVVCHTDMRRVGNFTCADPILNRLHENIVWGMRGNFFSVPTDCPQRDERMGWTGDLALFVPTATLLYDCFGILKNWLIDVASDQKVLNGVPPMVSPNATLPDPRWLRKLPCALWHDVTILAPWELYLESGDQTILEQQFESMVMWIDVIPRKPGTGLWDPAVYQLGDWLDPTAPPDEPWKSQTDSQMVANMFLVHSLDIMAKICGVIGRTSELKRFEADAKRTNSDFHDEYVSTNGRMISDSQTSYALGIGFDILTPLQKQQAGARLAELVRKNGYRIGTGFAGTPFVCEALIATGHTQVAYSMLLEQKCPSWLYPVTMGATTVWERWDSMLPDGSINPGKMTSFNHYAFGSIAKVMYERIGGLQRLSPGWERCRIAPEIGADFTTAEVSHVTRYGLIACWWRTKPVSGAIHELEISVEIPYRVIAELIIPEGNSTRKEELGVGRFTSRSKFVRDYEWPLPALNSKTGRPEIPEKA